MRSGDIKAIISVVDRASRPIRDIARRFKGLGSEASAMGRSVSRAFRQAGAQRLTRSVRNLGQAAKGAYGSVMRLLGPMARYAALAAGIAGGALTFGVIDTGSQFEGMAIQLEALEGSAAAARSATAWIEDFARRTPLQLAEVTDSYASLRNFGMDPTNGSLQAMVDTMAMSGKGAEQLQGIIMALGQAWTKQKLQGEEALQLMERGVPVWDLLSKATGKSVAQLQKLSSAGKLGQKWIALLIEEMGTRAAGASDRFSKSFAGIVSNLQDTFTSFQKMIADAGIFEAVKGRLGGVLDVVTQMKEDGSLALWAADISRVMTRMVDVIAGVVEGLLSVDEDGTTAIGRFADGVGGFLTNAGNFVDMIGGWEVAVGGLAVVIMGPALLAMGSLAAAIYGVALALASTGIGLVILGIAAAATVIIAEWSTVKEWLSDFFGWFGLSLEDIGSAIQTVFGWLGKLTGFKLTGGGLIGAIDKLAGGGAADEGSSGLAGDVSPVASARGQALQQEVSVRNQVDLTVRHENAPRGTRVDVKQQTRATPGVDTGLAMADG
ncbi:tape measure protein [Pyruvatibacter sp.]